MNNRTLSLVFGLVAVTGSTMVCTGQTHKVDPKPETVVRAVGVYEWTGDLTKPTGSRFVPVTVFIDGELEDAGIYKPQPVPFALVSGNVYELQDSGLPKGTLVLESAVDAKLPEGAPGPAFDEGWTGYGAFKPAGGAKKPAPLHASKNLPVLQVSGGDGSKPHLTDKTAESSKAPTQPQAASATKTADKTDPPSDPDRPTLHHRTGNDTASTDTSSPAGSSDPHDAERPTLKRRSPEEEKAEQQQKKQEKKQENQASVTSSGSIADDPDRPHLHHGSGEEGGDKEAPKLMGIPKDMHQMVAVSDAKNRDPHPFARPWEDSNEHAAILAKMQGFARAKLAEYGVVPGVTPPSAVAGSSVSPSADAGMNTPDGGPPKLRRGIPPKSDVTSVPIPAAPAASKKTAPARQSAHAGTRSHSRSAKAAGPAQVTLADEELKGYTLSYGGAPTYVYMAHTIETGSVMRYVTVVAQDDGLGHLKVALASVTDAAHLDRTPWMRLVDVVDVEASNRASLLFELRSKNSRQFALYRVIAAKPEQIFTTGG
ncbi:MAG TPA: hypothetical protein VHN81_05795 [Edaphobacter sp.]|nr:hypothetical protein [Edaphobacter sp.]